MKQKLHFVALKLIFTSYLNCFMYYAMCCVMCTNSLIKLKILHKKLINLKLTQFKKINTHFTLVLT